MSSDVEEIRQQIIDCENRGAQLTEWERGFITSIKERCDQGVALSRRQIEQLDIVWDRVTSKKGGA